MAETANKKLDPIGFFREVRREVAKVSWPTRKETGLTTLMVIIMTLLAAIFFLVVDQVVAWLVQIILGIGG